MKNISIFISLLLILNLAVPVYADIKDELKKEESLNLAIQEINYVDSLIDLNGTIRKDRYKEYLDDFALNSSIFLPKTAQLGIKAVDNEGNVIKMQLPDMLENSKGLMTGDGTIVYNSKKEDTTVLVQGIEEKINGESVYGVRSIIKIDNADSSKEYNFLFDLPKGYRLIESDDYIRLLRKSNTNVNANLIGDNLVYIINQQNDIVYTIDEPWAKDARGESVETYYTIEGNSLIQIVEFDENTVFPVIADPTYRGAIYKTETLIIENTASDIKKLIRMRREVDERQNSSLITIISHINSIFGLFNIYTGVLSLGIADVLGSKTRFLEECEDAYSFIIEELSYGDYSEGWIDYNYVGTYQGKNKGYVYVIRSIERGVR